MISPSLTYIVVVQIMLILDLKELLEKHRIENPVNVMFGKSLQGSLKMVKIAMVFLKESIKGITI